MPFIPTQPRNGVLCLLIQVCNVGHQGHLLCVEQQGYISRVGMNIALASIIRMFGRLTCHLCLPHSHPLKVQRPNVQQLDVQLRNAQQLEVQLPNDQRRKSLQLKLQ
jgi:hypothetical protein